MFTRLLDLQFPDEVSDLLDRHQVPAALPVIELTESTMCPQAHRR